MTIAFQLSPKDNAELAQLAADCGLTPEEFSKQCVENKIADRRLVRYTRKREEHEQKANVNGTRKE